MNKMTSIAKRIVEYELLKNKFYNPKVCFTVSPSGTLVGKDGDNILYSLDNIQKLAEGSFNTVYLVNDNIEGTDLKYIIRINKSTTFNINKTSDGCISDIYSLFFSNLVKDDIFPNFPLVVDSYLCNDDYTISAPITIQEYSVPAQFESEKINNLDAYISYLNGTDLILLHNAKKLVLQTILTYFFMNVTLRIAHNDAKAPNVLVKDITPTGICYKSNNKYINIDNVSQLALITDFDKTRSNEKTFKYDSEYVSRYYLDLAVQHLSISPDTTETIKKLNKVYQTFITRENDSPSKTFIMDLLTFACTSTFRTSNYIIVDFVYDLSITQLKLGECIVKYFGDVCEVTESLKANHKLYNLDIKVDPTYTTQHKMLYLCAYNNEEFRRYKGDPQFAKYLNDVYGLDRFDIIGVVSQLTINSFIQKPLPDIDGYLNARREVVYDYMNKFMNIISQVFESPQSPETLMKSFKLMDFILKNNGEFNIRTTDELQNHMFVCYYIFSDTNFLELVESASRISVQQLLQIMNKIFNFLASTK